jgi:hypothetical protein
VRQRRGDGAGIEQRTAGGGDGIAVGNGHGGIDERHSIARVVGAGDGVVVDGDRARAEGEHAGAEAVRLGAGDAHAGDGVVGHGGVGAGPGAGAADLDAVLGLHARTRTDDLVAVDIGGQGRAEDEDAGLLEQVDQRVLHRDRVFAGAGLTVGDDRVIALVSGRCLTGELVHLGHVHVVNEDVGVQRVDAAELSAAIGDGALVVAVDRQPLDGDVGAVLDADDRVLVGQAPAGVHQVDRQVGRVGGEDGGQPLSRAGQRDVLAVDVSCSLKVPAAMKIVSPSCAALIAAWIDMPAAT